MSEFWDMGGYAVFVWPSYALVIFALLALAISSRRRQRQMTERASQLRSEVRGNGENRSNGSNDDRKNDS